MCSRAIIDSPWWLLAPLCLFVGCSYLSSSHPSPLPAELAPDRVRADLTPTVTLDTVAQPVAESKPAGPVPARAGNDLSSGTSDGAALVLALPQAVELGLQNNPRLTAALAAIERAQGEEQAAFAPFLPQFDLLTHGGVCSPSLGPASAGASGIVLVSGNGTHSFYQAELQLQWTIWDFGRTAGRYRQAGAQTRSAELQSTRAEETVGFDVAAAYLDVLRAAAFQRIQEQAIRQARATLRDTRSRRAAGVADRDDVLRGEVHLAAAEEDLDVARETELAALARLNYTMGRNASLPLSVIDWQSEPVLELSLVQCLEIASNRRPEIGVAREAVSAAQSGRQAVAAEFLPRVYILGSAGGIAGGNVQTGGQEGIGLHIDTPLYTGGRHKGELRAAEAEIRRAVADARAILDGVTLQVTVAYLAATTARRRIERDRPAVVEARENLRLVRSRYRNGNATPTDIVDSETALTRAQQRLVSARYEYLGALVSLDYSLGNAAGHLLGPADAPDNPEPEQLPMPQPVPKDE
jgi:outer membrane protein TolC